MLHRHLAVVLLGAALLPAQEREGHRPGELFERVVGVLERGWPDVDFREEEIPEVAAEFRQDARETRDLAEERAVVGAFLAELSASHLALYSKETFDVLMAGVVGRPFWTYGFQLVLDGGRYRVDAVLDGGPADEAGLVRGDVALAIDGVPPARSPRLDWRSDDAWLDDPPCHALRARDAGPVRVRVERDGETFEVEMEPRRMTIRDASAASARVFERGDERIAYVHLWLVQEGGCASLLKELFEGPFADLDTLVLDLRGRGGSAAEVARVVEFLKRLHEERGLRLFALIDRGSRSGKEVIAARLREEGLVTLVGERTAGAVLPGRFADVGQGAMLMFPFSMSLGMTEHRLEGVGVEPDVEVAESWEGDPILARAIALALERRT